MNWGEVAVVGVLGGVGGGAAVAAKLGATGVRATIVAGAYSGAISGAGMSAYQYNTGPGPHTVGGFLAATATGGASGMVLGGAGGAAGHGIGAGINKLPCGASAAAAETISDVGSGASDPGVGTATKTLADTPATLSNEYVDLDPRPGASTYSMETKPEAGTCLQGSPGRAPSQHRGLRTRSCTRSRM